MAWGANCNQHHNDLQPGLRCKRSIAFRGGRMPEAEARVRMKQWLLAGAEIPYGPTSKDNHFAIDPLTFEVLEDEEELDRRAALLV